MKARSCMVTTVLGLLLLPRHRPMGSSLLRPWYRSVPLRRRKGSMRKLRHSTLTFLPMKECGVRMMTFPLVASSSS